MGGHKQEPAEREIVKSAMAILRNDWRAINGDFPTSAELGQHILGTVDGATNITRYILHGKFPSRGEKAIAGLNPTSGRLLQDWIAALSPRKRIEGLRTILSNAGGDLGLSEALITTWSATDGPIWPGVLHDWEKRDPINLFLVDLISLRRFQNHGPIYQALTQAWFTSLSLARSVAARSELREAAPVIWAHVMKNFVPPLALALQFGTFHDYNKQWLPPDQAATDEERAFRYHALCDSVSCIVDQMIPPRWVPDERTRVEVEAILGELRSVIAVAPTPSGNVRQDRRISELPGKF